MTRNTLVNADPGSTHQFHAPSVGHGSIAKHNHAHAWHHVWHHASLHRLAFGLAWLLFSHVSSALDFESFFERQDIPMLWIDPADGSIVDANPAAAVFYGHDRDTLRQMSINTINTLSLDQIAEERVLAASQGRNYFIFRHRLADLTSRSVEVYSHPYNWQGRELLLSVIHDITPGRNFDAGMWHFKERLEELVDLRTAETEARNQIIIALLVGGLVVTIAGLLGLLSMMKRQREAELAAQAANRAKSEFLANMSHEIRTPLNAIIGLSELQLEEELPPKVRQKSLQIFKSGQLLLGVLNDLLDFSKIEAGKLDLECQPLELKTIVDNLTTLFETPARSKGLTLNLVIAPEVPHRLVGDELRLTQVLANLVGNAVKFTEHGEVSLYIDAAHITKHEANLLFSVSDTGIGIGKDKQNGLFEAFSQTDGSITRRYGGTGLGLVISQRLVTLMGGDSIKVDSSVDMGSCFSFRLSLPLAQADSSELNTRDNPVADHADTATKNTCNSSNTRFRRQRVLVADDNTINQDVVLAQLARMNLDVVVVNNGSEAVNLMRKEHFDLILMDIHMPVMDGYRATQKIRSFDTHTPIIALTAATLNGDRQQALDVGMNDHLGKPFSSEELFACLLRWLETEPRATEKSDIALAPSTLGDTVVSATESANCSHTVLIVDDMPTNIKVLANLLKDEYVIQAASSGRRALEIATRGKPPDLVLLDIMMPDMDGLEVCRALKDNQATQRIPIIFVSALSEVSEEAAGLSLGAVDYITKPYHGDIVRARVRAHINLKIATDQLEEMSQIDSLTQVANRRRLDRAIDNEIRRHARGSKSLGLIMLDIDYFKAFNDHYGHGAGDRCLHTIAQALNTTIKRPSDLFARYGGEEFAAILPATDREGVERVAEAMRTLIDTMHIPHAHSAITNHVTISLGCVAQVITTESAADLFMLADQALYKAKELGRNRVVTSH